MFLLEWTANDLLLIMVGAVAIIGTVLWLVPAAKVPRKREYTKSEITAYDKQVTRYFLAAALALVIGSIHIIVKNVPGFWQWLWQAGYGGHLFRDLSNSHIIIVGGGTVLLTGITWYVLPRFVNRPLFSTTLASASFWLTLIGVFGFYAAWVVLGLVEGNMVRQGLDYMAAKEALGAWHRVPTRLTASIMGLGYWTYVLNVFLTAWVGRHVSRKPFGHLTKFAVVSAAALFVGTVQGVLQVLPANADWIHYAGKFGQYVDPISHAHVNLVTGMMVSLAAFFVFFSRRLFGRQAGKRSANRLFWALVPGSLAFYLAFLVSGLVLGGQANGYGGIQSPALAVFLGSHLRLILAAAGTLMLVGFWVYFVVLWQQFDRRTIGASLRQAAPSSFWLLSGAALVIGTFQGILQVIPATGHILTTPEEVPNIHAQLNMIGGVMLALMGLVYLLLPKIVGHEVDQTLRRRSLLGVAGGIAAYYVMALATGLLRYHWLSQGLDDVAAAAKLGWVGPTLLLVSAVPLFLGFFAFGKAIYQVTASYRAQMVDDMRQMPARFSGPMPERLKRLPRTGVLGIELVGGLFGWPGLGWLYAGQAIPAVGLLFVGPAIAWALLPMLFSPFSNSTLSQWGWPTLLVWLPASALVSSAALVVYLRRHMPQPKAKKNKPGRRIPSRLTFGIGLVLLALFSIPLVPLLSGIPEPEGQPKHELMRRLPDRAYGAYLALQGGGQSGFLKLFPWSFPTEKFPSESPVVGPNQVRNLTISQKGLDEPDRYLLYKMEGKTSHPVALRTQMTAFQRQLTLTPVAPLQAGNYLLDIPTGGMFAGREYYYFSIDPAVTALPPLAQPVDNSPEHATASPAEASGAGWLEILPLVAAITSGVMAMVMINRMRQKIRPQEVAWTVAFAMFATAAAAQVIGDLLGWTPLLARLYYVLGATLVVGWLGLGTWLVLVHKPWLRKLGLWSTLLLSGYGIGLVSQTPVNVPQLAETGWHALDKPVALTVLTISINSVGTLVLVGGALWSAWTFWRKRILKGRMQGLILLAAGALTVAAGGSLTRLGREQYLYVAMTIGVILMFWGYLKTIQPPAQPTNRRSTVEHSRAKATMEAHANI